MDPLIGFLCLMSLVWGWSRERCCPCEKPPTPPPPKDTRTTLEKALSARAEVRRTGYGSEATFPPAYQEELAAYDERQMYPYERWSHPLNNRVPTAHQQRQWVSVVPTPWWERGW